MTDSNSTPAPWVVDEWRAVYTDAPAEEVPHKHANIARVEDTPNWRANARPIAAAPEMAALLPTMLAALEAAEAWFARGRWAGGGNRRAL